MAFQRTWHAVVADMQVLVGNAAWHIRSSMSSQSSDFADRISECRLGTSRQEFAVLRVVVVSSSSQDVVVYASSVSSFSQPAHVCLGLGEAMCPAPAYLFQQHQAADATCCVSDKNAFRRLVMMFICYRGCEAQLYRLLQVRRPVRLFSVARAVKHGCTNCVSCTA